MSADASAARTLHEGDFRIPGSIDEVVRDIREHGGVAAGVQCNLASDSDLERLTKQVAECLSTRLRAPGVGVVLEAEHSCMTLRGVRAHGAKTVTSALLGTLRSDPASRAEFFALAGVPH